MLISIHPPNQTFKRVAFSNNSISTLDYYPKSVYYFETNEKGFINPDSHKIVFISLREKVEKFIQKDEESIFVKDFNEKNWREQSK
jgi:hypothetical protein